MSAFSALVSIVSVSEATSTAVTPGLGGGPTATREAPLVLVVDDDEDMRLVYMDCLAQSGYRTAGERDGAGGIEAALRLRPDAILMDVAMPGISGIEATRRIKADPRTRACLVIVVTGHGMTKFDEARAAGCDAFLCKPFDASTLDQVLRPLSTSAEAPKRQSGSAIVKVCSCGRDFSRKQWLALQLCGRMDAPPRELRNCTCGSSLVLNLENLEDEAPAEAALESPLEATGEADQKTIVVVDGDAHVRRLIGQFIGDACAVEFVDDGRRALDRVRSSPPSALITEILIPRLDGLTLCRLLKADPATEHVPILVISMLLADDRARQAGADAFLEKPLERKRFVASVRSVTAKRMQGAPTPFREPGAQ